MQNKNNSDIWKKKKEKQSGGKLKDIDDNH